MSDKQNYSDGIMLLAAIFGIFCYIMWTYFFELFIVTWYFIKAPLYNIISNIPKEHFSVIFDWTILSNTPLDFIYSSIRTFGEKLYYLSELFSKITYKDIKDYESFDLILQDNYNVTLNHFINIVNITTVQILSPIVILLFTKLSLKIIRKERFTTQHSVESLGIQESQIWVQIKPVIYHYNDFVDTKNLDDDWYAMAMKPFDYMMKNNILDSFKYTDDGDFENYGRTYYKINKDNSYNTLIKNLGEKWSGVEDLSFAHKALLSIMIPKMMRNPKLSRKMNDNLAIYYASLPKEFEFKIINLIKPIFILNIFGSIKYILNYKKSNKIRNTILKESKRVKKIIDKDMNLILEEAFPKDIYKSKGLLSKEKILIKKGEPLEIISNITDKHFYKKTVFASFLKASRKSGVLATCEFIWLKKIDRELWYVMSQMGRTACFIECAGAWSHYLTEINSGMKLSSPMVINAIKAMDKYMYYSHDNYEPFGAFED